MNYVKWWQSSQCEWSGKCHIPRADCPVKGCLLAMPFWTNYYIVRCARFWIGKARGHHKGTDVEKRWFPYYQ